MTYMRLTISSAAAERDVTYDRRGAVTRLQIYPYKYLLPPPARNNTTEYSRYCGYRYVPRISAEL